jgi:hypothetical protein
MGVSNKEGDWSFVGLVDLLLLLHFTDRFLAKVWDYHSFTISQWYEVVDELGFKKSNYKKHEIHVTRY